MLKTPLTAPIGYKNPMSNNVTHETAAIPDVQDFRHLKCRKSEVQPIFCQKGQLVIANRSCFTLEILCSSPFDKIFPIQFVVSRNTCGIPHEGPISGKRTKIQRKNISSGLYAIFFALAHNIKKMAQQDINGATRYGTNILYIWWRTEGDKD